MSETLQPDFQDHLSPDGSQDRIIDPLQAAHMAHAAHLEYRDQAGYNTALAMMKEWHEPGESPEQTAQYINEEAKKRVGQLILKTGNFDKYDATRAEPRRFTGRSQMARSVENVADEMIVAGYADEIVSRSGNDQDIVEKMSTGAQDARLLSTLDERMNEVADHAGNVYNRNMARIRANIKDK